MKQTNYTCDDCKALITENSNRLIYHENGGGGICFAPWPEVDETRDRHLCGQSCGMKVLQRWMENLHK